MRLRVWAGAMLAVAVAGGAIWWFSQAAPAHVKQEHEPRTLRIAAAADLRFALDEIASEFHNAHPEVHAEVTFGSSGNLFAQLSNGAPFDVFLSADVDYPRRLAEQGVADTQSLIIYAVGHLVLWVPESCKLDIEKLGFKSLLEPSIRKLAIANPRHAPYGRAAAAALKHAQVFDQVESKLVLGENIAQTAQFVQSGAADAGIVALSLALAPGMQEAGRYWELPADSYPRLEQGGIILTAAQDRAAAESFLAYLSAPAGKGTLKRFGFFLPGE